MVTGCRIARAAPAPRVLVRDVVAVSARLGGVSPDRLVGPVRGSAAEIAARFVAIAAARELGRGVMEIGRAMGRDHSTVIHALRRAPEVVADLPVRVGAVIAEARRMAGARHG